MYLASEFGRFYINRCNECLDFPCGCFCFSTDFWVCNRTIWHMRTLVISALDVLTFSTWVFCRRVSRSSTCEDVDTSLNVWFWIRWWVWQNRARSSAKSKSFNGVLRVHLVAVWFFFFWPHLSSSSLSNQWRAGKETETRHMTSAGFYKSDKNRMRR